MKAPGIEYTMEKKILRRIREERAMRRILAADDGQIIYFS